MTLVMMHGSHLMTSVMVGQAPSTSGRLEPDETVLRSAAASDAEAVLAMLARCSRTTLFHRFHFLTDGVAYFGAQLRDRPRDQTLIAWQGSTCVGVATLGVGDTGLVDLAVLVEDAWQRRGIGTRLTASLLDSARAVGVSIVHADVLSEDRHIVQALRRIGSLTWSIERGTWSIDVALDCQPCRPAGNGPPVVPGTLAGRAEGTPDTDAS